MASHYETPEEIANQGFVYAAKTSAVALEAAWASPARTFGVDDQWRSISWNAATFGTTQGALHIAAKHNKTDSIEWLLNKGANVNIVNSQVQTPLIVALQYKSWQAAEKLLAHGCETGAVTATGSGMGIRSLPVFAAALASSAAAIGFVTKQGVQPSADQFLIDSESTLLSVVTDCQRSTRQARPPPADYPTLLAAATTHVAAAWHYAHCSAPLVANATLDGAIAFLTGNAVASTSATWTQQEHGNQNTALLVDTAALVGERCPAISTALHPRGQWVDVLFPVWVTSFHTVKERMLPAVMVATWGLRSPSVFFLARLCGCEAPPLAAEGGGFPNLSRPHTTQAGKPDDAQLGDVYAAHLNSAQLLAAVAACQVGGSMNRISDACRSGLEGEVSAAAVHILLPCAASCALLCVRRLRAQATLPADTPGQACAAATLAFYTGGVQTPPTIAEGGSNISDVTHTQGQGQDGLLQYCRQQRRQVNPQETTPSLQRFVYCMAHSDMQILLDFATWQLRRVVVLRRAAVRRGVQGGNTPQ